MKMNIRSKLKRFLESEVGSVSVKAPLAVGIASGSVLLAQAIVTPSAAAGFECTSDEDCGEGEQCAFWCNAIQDGTCVEWHSTCS